MARPPVSRRERRKQEVRERILEAARELFLAQGVRATPVSAICARADVAQQTFFNHFPTKQHVVRAMAQAGTEELLANIELAHKKGRDTRERVQRFLGGVADVIDDAGPMHRELVAEIIHANHEVGGESEHGEQCGAGAIVAGGHNGGAGVDGHAPVGAEEVGDFVDLRVFPHEHPDPQPAADGIQFPEQLEDHGVGVRAGPGVRAEPACVSGAVCHRRRRFVDRPRATPPLRHFGGKRFGNGTGIAEHLVDGVQDGGCRAPGAGEHLLTDVRRITFANFMEEAVVAVAPQIQALLGVADVKERTPAFGVLHDFVDEVGEVNATRLAEAAADDVGSVEWLDDETHWIWDIAAQEAEHFANSSKAVRA